MAAAAALFRSPPSQLRDTDLVLRRIDSSPSSPHTPKTVCPYPATTPDDHTNPKQPPKPRALPPPLPRSPGGRSVILDGLLSTFCFYCSSTTTSILLVSFLHSVLPINPSSSQEVYRFLCLHFSNVSFSFVDNCSSYLAFPVAFFSTTITAATTATATAIVPLAGCPLSSRRH